jgi:hypothetical protein
MRGQDFQRRHFFILMVYYVPASMLLGSGIFWILFVPIFDPQGYPVLAGVISSAVGIALMYYAFLVTHRLNREARASD